MSEDLASFDVSSLDALAKLEADEHALKVLLEKAAWRRDKEVEVYSRVMADYELRRTAVLEQAKTVRERVREDLRKLDALHDHHREALDQATVQLQECEFRREIGEFNPEEFQRCQQAAQRTIGERDAEFESVRTLRLRYIALLPGESVAPQAPARAPVAPVVAPPAAAPPAAVVAPTPAAAAAPAVPPSPPPPAQATPAPAAKPAPPVKPGAPPMPAPTAAPTPAPKPAPKEESPAQGATVFLRPPSATDFQVPTRGKAASDQEAFGTIALAAPMLIEDRGGLPGTHHRLGLVTMIGRTPDNQIVVPVKEVSRRHAEIVLKDGGYVVRDLDAPNGTFVNGERITEHRLKDGDKVTVGGKVFVFKAP